MNTNLNRLQQLKVWIGRETGVDKFMIEPASEDASFRRYYRVKLNGQSHIVMDAPPEQEDCRPFIDITTRLASAGVNVPQIIASDMTQGFLLLSDLGSTLYLDCLDNQNVDGLYADAMAALLHIQARASADGLPDYDEALLQQEINLFSDWLLQRHLGLDLGQAQQDSLDKVFTLLIDSALQQPRVFVHRDYHSRNLMHTCEHNPGILDYQDAVYGPVSYDLVSLLKDCYIQWPRQRINAWAVSYCQRLNDRGVCKNTLDEAQFLRWFDLMGVQRHLKASGIFARLYHRDGKSGYLKDIPRTLSYILDLADDYPELQDLSELIETQLMPQLEHRN